MLHVTGNRPILDLRTTIPFLHTITSRLGHQRRKKTILRDANAQELVTNLTKPPGGNAIPHPRRKPRRDQWTCCLADKNENDIFHCDRENERYTHTLINATPRLPKPIQLARTLSHPTQKHAPQPTDIPTSSSSSVRATRAATKSKCQTSQSPLRCPCQ